jgi:LysR substrate binding domain-containing protein
VRIGCVPHLALQQLQAFLGALALRAPGAHAEVAHLRTAEQVRRLRAGTLDVGLIDDVVASGAIRTEPLFDGAPLVALLPLSHPLAAKAAIAPHDLRHERLLLFPRATDPALHDWFTALTTTRGYRFAEVRATGDAELRDVLLAVAEGRGVTLAPLATIDNAGEVGTLLVCRGLDPPQPSPRTVLAWSPMAPESRAELVAAARHVARALRS